MFYCLRSFASGVTPRARQKKREQEDTAFALLSTGKNKLAQKDTVRQLNDKGEKQREQEGAAVQVTNMKKLNSKHYNRVDINPFLYTQREGIGTTKRKERKKNKCNNVLVLRRYGTVKREKGKQTQHCYTT